MFIIIVLADRKSIMYYYQDFRDSYSYNLMDNGKMSSWNNHLVFVSLHSCLVGNEGRWCPQIICWWHLVTLAGAPWWHQITCWCPLVVSDHMLVSPDGIIACWWHLVALDHLLVTSAGIRSYAGASTLPQEVLPHTLRDLLQTSSYVIV